MPSDEPAGHHEFDRERIRFYFLEVRCCTPESRHSAQDRFIIEAGLVFEKKMPKLMRCSESLDAHRSFSGDQKRLVRAGLGTRRASLERPQKQRKPQSVDGAEHIYPTTTALDLLAQIKIAVEAGCRHRASPDGSRLTCCHKSAFRRARTAAEIFGETTKLLTILLR